MHFVTEMRGALTTILLNLEHRSDDLLKSAIGYLTEVSELAKDENCTPSLFKHFSK
jgi:hypothetical protein